MDSARPEKRAKLQDTSSLDDFPFLGQLSTDSRLKATQKWIRNKKVIGVLKQFKLDEIDNRRRYEQLQQLLGANGQDWDTRTVDMVKRARNPLVIKFILSKRYTSFP